MTNMKTAVSLSAALIGLTTVCGLSTSAEALDVRDDSVASATYYAASLEKPTTVAALVAAAEANNLAITSVRHGSEVSSGEMVVGPEGLAAAAPTYVETVEQNFGSAPRVLSFVTTTPVDVGTRIGDTVVAEVKSTSAASADDGTPALAPTPEASGGVTPASINSPWAPANGTISAYNSSTGSPRQVRHHLTWTSRAGLDSYDDYVYEHDNKIYDPNATVKVIATPYAASSYCQYDGFWMAHTKSTVIVSSNMPSAAKVYADNARWAESCGPYDISFGVFYPGELSTNVEYTVVVGGSAGTKASSPMGLYAQKLSNDCQALPDDDDCVGLNEFRGGQSSEPLINKERAWTFPGCYSWAQGQSPVSGTCP